MTDKLDTDDPDEVAAAARRFQTAITTVGRRVQQISDSFVACGRPESELDRQLVACTDTWIRSPLDRAVGANSRRVDATTELTTQVTYTHGDADRAGAAAVRRRTEFI
ncbi:hypothetical protein AB0346_14465 [Nocardia beijingensis]|uniref:hypothetical protein n=1 Tax=Nocardia beijingensis TaxID=95162 RepID=UPI00344DD88E